MYIINQAKYVVYHVLMMVECNLYSNES